ncbi:MAG: hypothetical protein GYB68_02890 [Chloroflexi bacterium]|nr:hypothetical protein [Chloroflexota bacterium]
MHSYDYRCKSCKTTFTRHVESYADLDSTEAACPKCGSKELSQLIGKVAVIQGEEAHVQRIAGLDGLEAGDPTSVGRLMREMSHEFGGDLGADFQEATERFEAGQAPDQIDAALDLPFPKLSDSDSP